MDEIFNQVNAGIILTQCPSCDYREKCPGMVQQLGFDGEWTCSNYRTHPCAYPLWAGPVWGNMTELQGRFRGKVGRVDPDTAEVIF